MTLTLKTGQGGKRCAEVAIVIILSFTSKQ